MKGKISRKLLGLLLTGIITMNGVELPVYAMEEDAGAAKTESESAIADTETQPASLAENAKSSSTDVALEEMPSTETSAAESEESEKATDEEKKETIGEIQQTEEKKSPSTETFASESGESEAETEEAKETKEAGEAEETEETKTVTPEERLPDLSAFVVNPLYQEIYDGEQIEALEELQANGASAYAARAAASFATVQDAADYVRGQMVARESTIVFDFPANLVPRSDEAFLKFAEGIVDSATKYTDACSGKEGDALAWGYRTYGARAGASGSASIYQMTFTFTYHSTAAQEEELTRKVNEAMTQLNLSGKSDYEKARAIHDYICDKVDYDYGLTKYSAYDALCTGKAVCQGYAVLFYRMCKEAGMSVRVISGIGVDGEKRGAHGWNIVKISEPAARAAGTYYNVDCTWDGQGSNTHHAYFLKNDADFVNHVRDPQYDTADFRNDFPMAETSYKLTNGWNADNIEEKDGKIYAFDGDNKYDNDQICYTKANGRHKILVFIQTTCPRSAATVQDIAKSDFSDVDLYVVSTKAEISEFTTFISQNAPSKGNIQFMYIGNNAWNKYFNLAIEYASWKGNEALPTVVYIDATNKVQHMTYGQQSAKGIRDNIKEYCSSSGSGGAAPGVAVYNITYEPNGGTNHADNPSAYAKGTQNIDLLAPTREGYDFKGWYTDAELTKLKPNIHSMDTGDLKLYAKWEKRVEIFEYKIAYVLDGGANHADNPSIYKTATEKITLKAPTRADYVFKGWYTDAAKTKPITEITSENSGDLTLYAKWEENPKDPADFPQIDMSLTAGNIMAGIAGSYETQAKDAILNRLNEIRLEACRNGIALPNGTKLTEADYVPLKWSSEMEAIARMRAAEAAVRLDWNHTRPSGKEWNTVRTTGNQRSMGENLGLNGGGIMGVIESFYGEKNDWVTGNTAKETGHYINMINPQYKYVGLGSFRLANTGNYPLAIAQEFSMFDGMDETKSDKAGYCIQDIEIAKSAVTKLAFEAQPPIQLDAGETFKLRLNAEIKITDTIAIVPREFTGPVRGGAIMESSDASVASVGADGTITALKPGTALISAKAGTASAEITVTVNGFDGLRVQEIAGAYYTGKPIEPSVSVYDGSTLLKENTDYTVAYSDNVEKGKATVLITGKGNYARTDQKPILTASFEILPAPLADQGGNPAEGVTVQYTEYMAVDGQKPLKPLQSVKFGKKLNQGTDYKIYIDGRETSEIVPKDEGGTFKLAIEGIGNYSGIIRKYVYVANKSQMLANAKITLGKKVKNMDYSKEGVDLALSAAVYEGGKYYKVKDGKKTEETCRKDDVYTVSLGNKSLICGTDFIASCDKPKGAGSKLLIIEGIGEYIGTKAAPFNVKGTPLKAGMVADGGFTEKFTYTGNALTQDNVKVQDQGKTLALNTDYTVSYKNNTNKGTALMTFTAKEGSAYSGSFTKKFKITAADISDIVEKAKRDGSIDKITVPYSKSGVDISDKIKLTNAGQPLMPGKDYTIKYKNCGKPANKTDSNAPTAIITGKGNYTGTTAGTADIKFTITTRKLDSDGIIVTVAPAAYDSKKAQGYEYKPKVTVKDGKGTLSPGRDYTVDYENNEQEDYEAYLKGTAGAAGTAGSAMSSGMPMVVVTAAEGSLYYTGNTKEIPIPIYETKLSSANLYVVVDKASYTGSRIEPKIAVYYGTKAAVDAAKKKEKDSGKKPLNGETLPDLKLLTADKEYTVSYGANINAGKNKGSVAIHGKEPYYGGSVTIKFTIEGRNL